MDAAAYDRWFDTRWGTWPMQSRMLPTLKRNVERATIQPPPVATIQPGTTKPTHSKKAIAS
jgi:hypothetical protein